MTTSWQWSDSSPREFKKTCNNATSNSYGPRQCFPLVVILKSLLPVIVPADIPQLEDDQAEVFSQSQSSLLGVAASRSHHPELLAVAILKEKAVYHHLEQRWERVQYIVVQLTSWQSCSVSELPVTCLALFRLYSLLPHNLVSLWNITLLMPTNHKMRQGITSMHFKFSPTQHCASTLDPRFDLLSILSPFLMNGSKELKSSHMLPTGRRYAPPIVTKLLPNGPLFSIRGEQIIWYSNIIWIIFEYQNIRIRIRSIFSNRIIFVFVFGWFFQTE